VDENHKAKAIRDARPMAFLNMARQYHAAAEHLDLQSSVFNPKTAPKNLASMSGSWLPRAMVPFRGANLRSLLPERELPVINPSSTASCGGAFALLSLGRQKKARPTCGRKEQWH
jgi:hypothetical protein